MIKRCDYLPWESLAEHFANLSICADYVRITQWTSVLTPSLWNRIPLATSTVTFAMTAFKVHFFSDSMLKHLDEAFQQLHYECYDDITCAPGSEITRIPQLTKHVKGSDLFVINTGINNLLNGYSPSNSLHLYNKVHQSLRQSHPTTTIALMSVSYVSHNRFDGTDRSAEINPLVSQFDDALEAYCSQHEMISFIDLRPYLRGTNDTLIDRTNLSSDGLHY